MRVEKRVMTYLTLWLCSGLFTITFPELAFPKGAVTVYEEETGERRDLTREEEQEFYAFFFYGKEPEEAEESKEEREIQIRMRSELVEFLKKLSVKSREIIRRND